MKTVKAVPSKNEHEVSFQLNFQTKYERGEISVEFDGKVVAEAELSQDGVTWFVYIVDGDTMARFQWYNLNAAQFDSWKQMADNIADNYFKTQILEMDADSE